MARERGAHVKYKVGQLVVNKKLGLGKVLEISGDEVIAFFKNELTNPRTINVSIVPMEIADEQADPFFDTMDARGLARLKRPSKRRAPARAKTPKIAKQPVAEAVEAD
jgi:hypothetical protein